MVESAKAHCSIPARNSASWMAKTPGSARPLRSRRLQHDRAMVFNLAAGLEALAGLLAPGGAWSLPHWARRPFGNGDAAMTPWASTTAFPTSRKRGRYTSSSPVAATATLRNWKSGPLRRRLRVRPQSEGNRRLRSRRRPSAPGTGRLSQSRQKARKDFGVTYHVLPWTSSKTRSNNLRNTIFITGTDTDVGKTAVSAWACQAWDADYWKPVQAGWNRRRIRKRSCGWAGCPDPGFIPPHTN